MLADIDAYYQAALAGLGRVEQCGPFDLFVSADPQTHFACARPVPERGGFTGELVLKVLARQHELGEPGVIMWVHERVPALAGVVDEISAPVVRYPLLGGPRRAEPGRAADSAAELLSSVDLRARQACKLLESIDGPPMFAHLAGPLAEGATSGRVVLAAATRAGRLVAAGGHLPRGEVTLMTGIAARPGIADPAAAEAVARVLTRSAAEAERVPFLVAGSPDAARPYRRIGYRPVGTLSVVRVPTPTDRVRPIQTAGWGSRARPARTAARRGARDRS